MAGTGRGKRKKLTDALYAQLWNAQGKYPVPGTPGWANMPPDAQEWWANMLDGIRELRDCQRYHCLPSALAEEDWHVIARHRAIEAAERKYRDARRESEQRGRR